MEKSSSKVIKMLMVGGATIALLAPIAASPMASNIMPNTSVTANASRRHHHKRSHKAAERRAHLRAVRRHRAHERKLTKHYKAIKSHVLKKLRKELRHTHKKATKRHIRRSIRNVKRLSTRTPHGRGHILIASMANL